MDAKDLFETEPSDFEPQKFGRYVFRRPLATGGLGVVSIYYDVELNREVALKEILGERADDPRHRNSFCAEAEVTGLLEHPGVVPIYSLGTGDDGRPYYAMRLISGNELREHIVRYHKAVAKGEENVAGPKLRQLLQRVIDVCNVIHYAHARGVLHRDLKSINVMLGRYGETLVIDWGLAKTTGKSAIDSLTNDREAFPDEIKSERPVSVTASNLRNTLQGSTMGTIAYAPPEQLNGRTDEIDARSDIYSIGAILYEVLTGDPPCRKMGITEALRAIESGEIPSPLEVKREIPRPLSAICAKAISASREQRYQTAKEMRNDLQRWLDDEPVTAYAESLRERIWRWKRQHETFVRWATLSLAAVTLISIFAAYRINIARKQQEQARNEATELLQLARTATDNLLTKTSERLEEIPDVTDVQEELLRDAAESYRKISEFQSNDPDLQRESARAGIRLAGVLKKLEKKEDAIKSLESARGSLRSLNDDVDRVLLAQTYVEQSRIHGNDTRQDIEQAAEAIDKAYSITQKLAIPQDASAQALLVHAQTLIQKGVVATDLGQVDAVSSFKHAAETIQRMLALESDREQVLDIQLELIRARVNETAGLDDDDPTVRERYESVIEQAAQLVKDYPDDLRLAKERGKALNNYADHLLRKIEELDAAEARYQESADEFSDLVEKKPLISEYREFLTLSLIGLGNVASDRGDRAKAIDQYSRATEVAEKLLEQNKNRTSFLLVASQAKCQLGEAQIDTDLDRAKKLLSDARELLPNNAWKDQHLADQLWYIEYVLLNILKEDFDTPDENVLLARLSDFARETSSFTSPQANLTVAAEISKACNHLQDPSTQSQYLDIAADHLMDAIKKVPEFQNIAVQDKDLSLLRARRPKAFERTKSTAEKP